MNMTVTDHDALRDVIQRPRRKGRLYRHRWIALFVGLPTLLAIIYYGLIATPIYVSQSSFVIKSPGQKSMPTLSLANIVQTSGLSSGQEQTKEILQYMRSRNALRDLERHSDFRGRYSGIGVDFLSRFPQPFHDATFENLFRYYGSVVNADMESESGLAVVQVSAFAPKDAFDINTKLLGLSEELVNRLNRRAEGTQIAEARQRVSEAEDRVRKARIELGLFRNQQGLLDPVKQAGGVLEISNNHSERSASEMFEIGKAGAIDAGWAPPRPTTPDKPRYVVEERFVGR